MKVVILSTIPVDKSVDKHFKRSSIQRREQPVIKMDKNYTKFFTLIYSTVCDGISAHQGGWETNKQYLEHGIICGCVKPPEKSPLQQAVGTDLESRNTVKHSIAALSALIV